MSIRIHKIKSFSDIDITDYLCDDSLVLLSGGSVAKLYKRIQNSSASRRIRIHNCAFAQVDERFQPQNIEDTNAYKIGKIGFPFFTISHEGSLEETTWKYNEVISKLFKEYKYKIAILGIGEDGHTAGLLPGYQTEWDIDSLVSGYENESNLPHRITITPKAIRELDQAIVVAKGANKKEIINRLFRENCPIDEFPAMIIKSIPKVDIFTD